MKLSEFASIAEIVGAIAIIASLMYVALQVEQNTIAIKTSNEQSRLDFGRAQEELLAADADFAELVLKAESNTETLTEVEHLRFFVFTTWRISAWEVTYVNYVNGIVDERTWEAWDAGYRLVIAGKLGYRQFFRDTRAKWDVRFMSHVDGVINAEN